MTLTENMSNNYWLWLPTCLNVLSALPAGAFYLWLLMYYRGYIWDFQIRLFKRHLHVVNQFKQEHVYISIIWIEGTINITRHFSTETYRGSFTLNPLTAKLINMNFHPHEVVSRWRDPQLQVSENYSDLTKRRSTVFKSCWLMSHFIGNMFKRWYIMC